MHSNPSEFLDWEIEYQTALREYSERPSLGELHRAITACTKSLVEVPRDTWGFVARRNCLLALSDLLILRILHTSTKRGAWWAARGTRHVQF